MWLYKFQPYMQSFNLISPPKGCEITCRDSTEDMQTENRTDSNGQGDLLYMAWLWVTVEEIEWKQMYTSIH